MLPTEEKMERLITALLTSEKNDWVPEGDRGFSLTFRPSLVMTVMLMDRGSTSVAIHENQQMIYIHTTTQRIFAHARRCAYEDQIEEALDSLLEDLESLATSPISRREFLGLPKRQDDTIQS